MRVPRVPRVPRSTQTVGVCAAAIVIAATCRFLEAQPVTARIDLDNHDPLPAQSIEVHVTIDLTSTNAGLGAYQASLSWDSSVLQFAGIGNGETFAFQGPMTRLDADELTFSHFSVAGVSGVVSLLKPRFTVVGAPGDSTALSLSFTALDAARSFEDLLPHLAVIPAQANIADNDLLAITGELKVSREQAWTGSEIDVEVALKLPPGSEKLGAYEALLSWDDEVLELSQVLDGSSSRFLDPQTRRDGDGTLKFANFSVEGAGGRVSLLNLKFRVIGELGARSSLALHFQTLDAAGTFANLRPHLEVVPVIIDVIESPRPHSPDFDGDDFVDIDDFFMFADAFGSTEPEFDVDGDGMVGLEDFFRFADAFGKPAPDKE